MYEYHIVLKENIVCPGICLFAPFCYIFVSHLISQAWLERIQNSLLPSFVLKEKWAYVGQIKGGMRDKLYTQVAAARVRGCSLPLD